ncbi:hypothetical protein RFI_13877 [Reticulomyxa filosa]|uniref:Uncharacterized protein n=1 Tax=Reticulomyxa filosa TaxID=46433 RepID=X6NBM8_RETFI|nr:hypothetical protein RFI_13877 [Reticulomyxa filosa]|eukprot:ETO23303.1 hypothetical protein RFI_13877 [Reticulomyxa filosa]
MCYAHVMHTPPPLTLKKKKNNVRNCTLGGQSESVANKNDTEHSPEVIQEELSQSDSCLDDDVILETPHQMGRFFVEKVNKQELAKDVKSHTNAVANVNSVKQNSSNSNSFSNVNESPHHSIHYERNSIVDTTNTNTTVIINVNAVALGSNGATNATNNNAIEKDNSNRKMNNVVTESTQQRDDETNNDTTIQSTLLSLSSLSRSNSFNKNTGSTTILSRPIAQWTKQDCVRWISSLGDAYIGYAAIFEKNGDLK